MISYAEVFAPSLILPLRGRGFYKGYALTVTSSPQGESEGRPHPNPLPGGEGVLGLAHGDNFVEFFLGDGLDGEALALADQ